MGQFIEQLGMQAANAATGGIMGHIFGGMNDARQLKQQEALQELQMKGQRAMTDYEWQKQLDMWKATSYPAQIQMMKQAGLSPGLIYGKGGGGGATTGNASGHVQGATAPSGGGEMMHMISMGLMEAQRKNIEADTRLKDTQTTKTGGVDTQKVTSEIANLTQGIKNQQAQEKFTTIQTAIATIEEKIKEESAKDAIDRVAWETGRALYEMEMAEREAYIQKATRDNIIDTIRAEMFGAWIKNAMMKAGTANIEQQTIASQKMLPLEMMDLIRKGIQGWKQLDIGQQHATTDANRQQHDAWLNDVQKSTGIPLDLLKEAADGILRRPSGRTTREYRDTPKGQFETYREEKYY